MKVKNDLVITDIDEGYVAVDADTSSNRFTGIIKLNKTAKYIVEMLQNEISYADLLKNYINYFEISEIEGKQDIDMVISKLEEANVLIK